MELTTQPMKRIRIQVSISVKGIKTWDCTVEMADTPQEEVLAESARLVAALELKHPPQN
jgi:hypothetical protein